MILEDNCYLLLTYCLMLSTILSLFARSPFAPLESHMERVSQCVDKLTELFQAIESGNIETQEQIVQSISELEHYADMTKNEIRNHLPKGLFMPIDRSQLLEILTLQDSIADTAQDIAILTTMKPVHFLPEFKAKFFEFLDKNLEAFRHSHLIIREIHELLESSFGGVEAEKVRSMVHQVAYKEHEADLIQRELIKSFFACEDKMSYGTFMLWERIFENVGNVANIAEKLSNRVRMTLELKQ